MLILVVLNNNQPGRKSSNFIAPSDASCGDKNRKNKNIPSFLDGNLTILVERTRAVFYLLIKKKPMPISFSFRIINVKNFILVVVQHRSAILFIRHGYIIDLVFRSGRKYPAVSRVH